jgi:lysophospholipid hydrolase
MALEDCGVPVDLVGGTSQGAFMAGLYAQDLGRVEMQVRGGGICGISGNLQGIRYHTEQG